MSSKYKTILFPALILLSVLMASMLVPKSSIVQAYDTSALNYQKGSGEAEEAEGHIKGTIIDNTINKGSEILSNIGADISGALGNKTAAEVSSEKAKNASSLSAKTESNKSVQASNASTISSEAKQNGVDDYSEIPLWSKIKSAILNMIFPVEELNNVMSFFGLSRFILMLDSGELVNKDGSNPTKLRGVFSSDVSNDDMLKTLGANPLVVIFLAFDQDGKLISSLMDIYQRFSLLFTYLAGIISVIVLIFLGMRLVKSGVLMAPLERVKAIYSLLDFVVVATVEVTYTKIVGILLYFDGIFVILVRNTMKAIPVGNGNLLLLAENLFSTVAGKTVEAGVATGASMALATLFPGVGAILTGTSAMSSIAILFALMALAGLMVYNSFFYFSRMISFGFLFVIGPVMIIFAVVPQLRGRFYNWIKELLGTIFYQAIQAFVWAICLVIIGVGLTSMNIIKDLSGSSMIDALLMIIGVSMLRPATNAIMSILQITFNMVGDINKATSTSTIAAATTSVVGGVTAGVGAAGLSSGLSGTALGEADILSKIGDFGGLAKKFGAGNIGNSLKNLESAMALGKNGASESALEAAKELPDDALDKSKKAANSKIEQWKSDGYDVENGQIPKGGIAELSDAMNEGFEHNDVRNDLALDKMEEDSPGMKTKRRFGQIFGNNENSNFKNYVDKVAGWQGLSKMSSVVSGAATAGFVTGLTDNGIYGSAAGAKVAQLTGKKVEEFGNDKVGRWLSTLQPTVEGEPTDIDDSLDEARILQANDSTSEFMDSLGRTSTDMPTRSGNKGFAIDASTIKSPRPSGVSEAGMTFKAMGLPDNISDSMAEGLPDGVSAWGVQTNKGLSIKGDDGQLYGGIGRADMQLGNSQVKMQPLVSRNGTFEPKGNYAKILTSAGASAILSNTRTFDSLDGILDQPLSADGINSTGIGAVNSVGGIAPGTSTITPMQFGFDYSNPPVANGNVLKTMFDTGADAMIVTGKNGANQFYNGRISGNGVIQTTNFNPFSSGYSSNMETIAAKGNMPSVNRAMSSISLHPGEAMLYDYKSSAWGLTVDGERQPIVSDRLKTTTNALETLRNNGVFDTPTPVQAIADDMAKGIMFDIPYRLQ